VADPARRDGSRWDDGGVSPRLSRAVAPAASMRAIGYVRVSTGRQATVGSSLEAQTAAIETECARRGWELVRIESEAQSAKGGQHRPVLEVCKLRLDDRQADALIVARMDRAFRSVGDFAAVMAHADRKGWALRMLDPDVDMTQPYGRAMAGVSAVFAQLERELIAQRTRDGIAARKAAGIYRGGRALPQCEPVAQETTRRIMGHHRRGKSSRQIAKMLTLAGEPTPRGGTQWSDRTVRRVIERETGR
jgi:DNA invertase Pin-like site-specific DNA recombinase